MAANLQFSTALRNASMDAVTTAVGNAGKLRIYAGSEPADANTAITGQTLLVEETLGSPFAPGSSGGVLSPTLPSQVNAASTGTAAFYRVYKSDGTTCVMQDTCGTSAAGMILNTLSLTVGGPVLVTSWTITAGMA